MVGHQGFIRTETEGSGEHGDGPPQLQGEWSPPAEVGRPES